MQVKNILIEAEEITSGNRQNDYGSPEDSFRLIANLWKEYLCDGSAIGINITPLDVAHMMILLKVARNSVNYKHDNAVDIAGYARTLQMMEERN